MAPVHLALLAGLCFKSHERPLAVFFPPGRHRQLQLRIAAGVTAAANLIHQLAGVMDPLLPTFSQEHPIGVDFAWCWMLPLIWLWLLIQILADGLSIHVEFPANRRDTQSLLLQISYVHKSLQVQHWTPHESNSLSAPGEFSTGGLGKFQSAVLGKFRPALTLGGMKINQITETIIGAAMEVHR